MNEQTRNFIRDNADKDVRTLALSGKKLPEVDLSFALDQIAGRQTARHKLPTWAEHANIIYPPHLSMEQCSSETTAKYKTCLVANILRSVGVQECWSVDNSIVTSDLETEKNNNYSPSLINSSCNLLSKKESLSNLVTKTMVDLTGGFGVDFSFMSRGFQKAIYIERQEHLCKIAEENFRTLELINTKVICGDGVEYLRNIDQLSLIYLDPARRNEHGGKTYAISDCTPDLIEIKDLLLTKADKVIVKLSPMLDWRKAVEDLNGSVSEVHIVSVNNECKELLLVMEAASPAVKVVCANIQNGRTDLFGFDETDIFRSSEVQEFRSGDNTLSCSTSIRKNNNELHELLSSNLLTRQLVNSSTEKNNSFNLCNSLFKKNILSNLPTYIYEPNASIMKAGCFLLLEQRFGVKQVAPNSHLFTSTALVQNFPGRKFRLETITTMNKKEMKKALSGIEKANISVRNFPLSVEELRKRLKIKEGGSNYIFATTLHDKSHVLLLCCRV